MSSPLTSQVTKLRSDFGKSSGLSFQIIKETGPPMLFRITLIAEIE
jgi:hypothetical protein